MCVCVCAYICTIQQFVRAIKNMLVQKDDIMYVCMYTFARTFGTHTNIHNMYYSHVLWVSHVLRLDLLEFKRFFCTVLKQHTVGIKKFLNYQKAYNLWIKMALSVPKAPGVAQMLKDGARVSRINRSLFKKFRNLSNLFEFTWKNRCFCSSYCRCRGAHVNHTAPSKKRFDVCGNEK